MGNLEFGLDGLGVEAEGFREFGGELFRGADSGGFATHGGSDDGNTGQTDSFGNEGFLDGVDGFTAGENVVDENDLAVAHEGGTRRNFDQGRVGNFFNVAAPVFRLFLGQGDEAFVDFTTEGFLKPAREEQGNSVATGCGGRDKQHG